MTCIIVDFLPQHSWTSSRNSSKLRAIAQEEVGCRFEHAQLNFNFACIFRNKTIGREDKENTENILPLQDEMDEMQHFLFAQSCEQGLYDDGNHELMNLDENSKVCMTMKNHEWMNLPSQFLHLK